MNGDPPPREITTPTSLGRIVITDICVPAFRVMEPTVLPSTTSGTGSSAIKVPGVGVAWTMEPIKKKITHGKVMRFETLCLHEQNIMTVARPFLIAKDKSD